MRSESLNPLTRCQLDRSKKVALTRPVDKGKVTAPEQVDPDNCACNGIPVSKLDNVTKRLA